MKLPSSFFLNFHVSNYYPMRSVKSVFVVVFLISVKESISDFYWYYSGKEIIDEPGKKNFSKAMIVAKQIFNSLTEYIQVPQNVAQNTGQ